MNGHSMKRQRGRGRKPGGGGHHNNTNNSGGHQHPNRTLESNGPDMKVRGPASHIYERYLQLARDASSSGDRVMAENYLQHAEHYFRMLRAMQPAMPPPSTERFGNSNQQEFEGDDEGPQGDNEGSENEAGGEGDQPDVEFAGASQQQPRQQQQGDDRDDRRRRGRRSRFRPEGERAEGGEPREGGDERPERAERPEGARPERQEGASRPERGERQERGDRPPRQPRERDGERPAEAAEGFSSGPKPAFLGSD